MAAATVTVAWVRERVAEVAAAAESVDFERAHSLEDALHEEVLAAVSLGWCEDPAACAREALATRSIAFERWRA